VCEGVLQRAVDKEGNRLRGRFALLALFNGYVAYQRKLILGGSLNGADEYTVARTRKMNASARIEELRLARIHHQLHHADDVEFVLTQMITAAKSRLLAIPSRVTRLLIGKTVFEEIHDLLTTEIELALRELAEYDPARFDAANEEYLASVRAAKRSGNGQEETPEEE
jgi:phage terminase Nu1 subunit (DNA packaging protein)